MRRAPVAVRAPRGPHREGPPASTPLQTRWIRTSGIDKLWGQLASQLSEVAARRLEQLDEGPGTRAQRAGLVVDDMEVPPDSHAAEPQLVQSAGRQLAPNGVARHKGHSQPHHDRLFDRFRVTEFHGCVDVPTDSLKGTLGDLTGG